MLEIPSANSAFVETLSCACPTIVRLAQIPIVRGRQFGVVGNWDIVIRARHVIFELGNGGNQVMLDDFMSEAILEADWCGSAADGEVTSLSERLNSALDLRSAYCPNCQHVI
jgi:hypothetical protein